MELSLSFFSAKDEKQRVQLELPAAPGCRSTHLPRRSDFVRTIPWAQLLCPMGTARPFLRWIAAKHGTTNEPFYHQEAALPMEAEACSRGTPGQAEHRARKASGHGEDMLDCRPGGMRGGFML